MMQNYAKLYYWYHNLFFVVGKALVIFLLLGWFFVSGLQGEIGRIPLFLISIIVMGEVFFHFKVFKVLPVTLSSNTTKDPFASFTLQALHPFLAKEFSLDLLIKNPEVLFILEKAGIAPQEVPRIPIDTTNLAQAALQVAKNVSGLYVTSMDVFCAYVLLLEPQYKLLFAKGLKENDLLHIVFWARKEFPSQEHPPAHLPHFSGEGLGEDWVYGWTIETQKYTMDITSSAFAQKPSIIGRESEYKQLIEALCKPDKNDVLLVGEAGVGKRNIVYALAYASYTGELSGVLEHQRLYELMVDALLAGSQDQGELETRLKSIIAEISHSGNVLLFIPEFQNIAGASSFHLDLSGALLPYLENGNLKVIGTITPANFKIHLAPQKSLLEEFAVINVPEPDDQVAMQMVVTRVDDIEAKSGVRISYKAVGAACLYARRYLQDESLPGSAITLLEDAAARIALSQTAVVVNGRKVVMEQDITEKIHEKTGVAVGEPTEEEKQMLLHLEDTLHKRVVEQDEAISAVSAAMRRLRSGLSSTSKPISFLFLGPTGVGKTETAKALAAAYFGGEDKMIRLDMSEYKGEDGVKRLLGAPPGEGNEQGELTDKIHDHPYSLVLLDEFEKANPNILDLFLQVLDDGRLTDNKGKTVSFSSAIIIATSNAGSEFIREQIQKGRTVDESFQKELLGHLQTQGIFKPELLNRFDAVVVYKPLDAAQTKAIASMLLTGLAKKLDEQDITVTFDPSLLTKISAEGTDTEFGARPLNRYVQDKVEDLLAQKMLRGEIGRGSHVTVSTDASGTIIATV